MLEKTVNITNFIGVYDNYITEKFLFHAKASEST